MARVSLSHDKPPAESVKEPKFHFQQVFVKLVCALDQQFGSHIGPVFEIYGMLEKAGLLRILQEALSIQDFKITCEVYGFLEKIGKSHGIMVFSNFRS
jgi:hypothetical protein